MFRKKTSRKWCKKLGIGLSWIYDPDGWDRTNWEYSFYREKITKEEFISRMLASTVRFEPAMRKLFGGE